MLQNLQTHSLESFIVLSRALESLTSEAFEKIRSYIAGQMTGEGVFANRSGEPDLYYSVFGLSCAALLDVAVSAARVEEFLDEFAVDDLDMVDLSCYVKCRAFLAQLRGVDIDGGDLNRCFAAAGKFRTANGLFSYDGKGTGFPYAAFLALNLYQDLERDLPDREKLLNAINSCRADCGGFFNPEAGTAPMLASTAAAVQVIRYLSGRVDARAVQWLGGQYRAVGGFSAAVSSPVPDMLSTAVALFTLSVCGWPLDGWRSDVRGFIDDHWDECGGFRATVTDDDCDCEYTYYGLLALGSIG